MVTAVTSTPELSVKDRWRLFGDYVKSQIEELGLTQRRFAEVSGIPQYQISRDVRSGRALPAERVHLYRDALHMDATTVEQMVGDLIVTPDPVEQTLAILRVRLQSLLDAELLDEVEDFTRQRLTRREKARA